MPKCVGMGASEGGRAGGDTEGLRAPLQTSARAPRDTQIHKDRQTRRHTGTQDTQTQASARNTQPLPVTNATTSDGVGLGVPCHKLLVGLYGLQRLLRCVLGIG